MQKKQIGLFFRTRCTQRLALASRIKKFCDTAHKAPRMSWKCCPRICIVTDKHRPTLTCQLSLSATVSVMLGSCCDQSGRAWSSWLSRWSRIACWLARRRQPVRL